MRRTSDPGSHQRTSHPHSNPHLNADRLQLQLSGSAQTAADVPQVPRTMLDVHTLYSKLGWHPHALLTQGAVNDEGHALRPPSAHVMSCLSALTRVANGSCGSQGGDALHESASATQQDVPACFPAAVVRLGLGRSRSLASLSLQDIS